VTRLASIVDGKALLDVVWISLAAGVGVTAVFGLAIHGTARAVEMRRNGRPGGAVAFAAMGGLALLVVGGSIALALIVMTQKD